MYILAKRGFEVNAHVAIYATLFVFAYLDDAINNIIPANNNDCIYFKLNNWCRIPHFDMRP